MPSLIAPSPNPDEANPANRAIRNLAKHDVTAGIAEPVLLFYKDYATVFGKLADFMPTEAPASKCSVSPRRKAAMAVSSPDKAFVATAATAVHIVAH